MLNTTLIKKAEQYAAQTNDSSIWIYCKNIKKDTSVIAWNNINLNFCYHKPLAFKIKYINVHKMFNTNIYEYF